MEKRCVESNRGKWMSKATEYVWYSEIEGVFYVVGGSEDISKLFSGKGPMLFLGEL